MCIREETMPFIVTGITPDAQTLIDAIAQKRVQTDTALEKAPTDVRERFGGTSALAARDIYNIILQLAQRRSEEVRVKTVEPPQSALGRYTPSWANAPPKDRQQIEITNFPVMSTGFASSGVGAYPTYQGYQQTLSHELIHFLADMLEKEGKLPRIGEKEQHLLIPYILGHPGDPSGEELSEAQPLSGSYKTDNSDVMQLLAALFPAPSPAGFGSNEPPTLLQYILRGLGLAAPSVQGPSPVLSVFPQRLPERETQ